jgi:hypothetical protein
LKIAALSCAGLNGHLERVSDAIPPFAPPRAVFPCPGLAAQTAKAPLGGQREALLGTMMVARLAGGMRGPHPLPIEARRARANGVRSWLTALAVPTKLRSALQHALQASAAEDPRGMAEALEGVTDITAPHMDRVSRSELARLVAGLRAEVPTLAGVAHRSVE